jgi:2-oxoglutarate ferredoxin oxidoreductase subunit gamma
MSTHEIIVSGFGGQGVLAMGGVLAYGGLFDNRTVSMIPSYGPEMRGGTAYCSVVISEDVIASPVVTEPMELVVMNQPSLDKFEDWLITGGTLLVNSSMISKMPRRKDLSVFLIPASEIAVELGNLRVANMVMLGALLEVSELVSIESASRALEKVIPPKYHSSMPMNLEAMGLGRMLIRKAAHHK